LKTFAKVLKMLKFTLIDYKFEIILIDYIEVGGQEFSDLSCLRQIF